MDDLCDSFDLVGTGIGHFVHDGWVRPYPIGHCPDSSRGQSCSGTETLVGISALRKERNLYAHQSDNACWDRSDPSRDSGFCSAFAYQGITYTSREKVIDIGPLHATAETQKTIPLSPLVGGLALVGGIVLVVLGAKKV